MKTKIYTLTHKSFDVPKDTTYVPLQVGAACHDDLGYLRDDTGDNISELNCYYSELTGLYWIWKNVKDLDIVGVCHYRRFLLNDKEFVLTKPEIEVALTQYDILTSKSLDLNFSYYYGFGENHDRGDLDKTLEVLRRRNPKFADLFEKRVHEKHTYFGNIMICKKSLFDEYCSFLFPIFEELNTMVDLDDYDSYHKRLFGFISEFMLFVWCEYKGLKVLELKVGIIGEKKETREVKEKLYCLIHEGKVEEAKGYFLDARKKRPDILMEASDITGELHLLIEIISICEFESSGLGKIVCPIDLEYRDLISWVNNLNNAVKEEIRNKASEPKQEAGMKAELENKKINASEPAILVATKLMEAAAKGKHD